jgi:hypothetical protein
MKGDIEVKCNSEIEIVENKVQVVQESNICQYPISYLTKPPDGIGKRIDCVLDIKGKGSDYQRREWKAHIPAEFLGQAMPTVPRTFSALTSLACKQGFKSREIEIKSLVSLTRIAGYKPNSGDRIIQRDLNYLFGTYIETNVYQLIGVDKRRIKGKFHLIEEDIDCQESNAKGSRRMRKIILSKMVFKAITTYYGRFFTIDAEI